MGRKSGRRSERDAARYKGAKRRKDETTTTRHVLNSLGVSSSKEKSREENTDSLSGEHAE